MTNQVILFDRMANCVKLIDGVKVISLDKAKRMGFTPKYLIQIACDLLSLDHDLKSKKALRLAKLALTRCPTSQWDQVKYIISYDRMSDKVKIFGGAITVPFRIAVHKGITPAHMVRMAAQLLSLQKRFSAVKAAKEALEACKLAQANQAKYKNKRFK